MLGTLPDPFPLLLPPPPAPDLLTQVCNDMVATKMCPDLIQPTHNTSTLRQQALWRFGEQGGCNSQDPSMHPAQNKKYSMSSSQISSHKQCTSESQHNTHAVVLVIQQSHVRQIARAPATAPDASITIIHCCWPATRPTGLARQQWLCCSCHAHGGCCRHCDHHP
jgi:hypothetical protein